MHAEIYPADRREVLRRMHVIAVRTYRGPHLYSHLPMIQIQLDLGSLEQWPSDKLDGFVEHLTRDLPGLLEHGCSYGEPGGFVRRMQEGTWLGHVIEHVAIELQARVGMPVTRGKTRSVRGRPGVYNVMFCYVDEKIGLAAGRLAVNLVNSLLPPYLQSVDGLHRLGEGEAFTDLASALADLAALAATRALGPTTASLVHEAERRHIPV